jgi:hypothetical protein
MLILTAVAAISGLTILLACRSSKPCLSRDVSGDDGEGDPEDGTRTPAYVADGSTSANRARHAPWPRAVRAAHARLRVGPRLWVRQRVVCSDDAARRPLQGRRPSVNARRSPSRVLGGDSTDERSELRIDRWTSASVSALRGPVELEALAMPADHGLGLHDDQSVVPVWPQAAEGDPECAVRLGQPGAFGLALHNGQLLSQGEVLERELRLQARSSGCEQDVQQGKHRGRLA